MTQKTKTDYKILNKEEKDNDTRGESRMMGINTASKEEDNN
jgi:hypothetical protein